MPDQRCVDYRRVTSKAQSIRAEKGEGLEKGRGRGVADSFVLIKCVEFPLLPRIAHVTGDLFPPSKSSWCHFSCHFIQTKSLAIPTNRWNLFRVSLSVSGFRVATSTK